ncbi:MAG: hypothetical protein IKF00_11440 [Solobacterium sp.]|nr:hypothetical protein [Solobacterium sp.]
MVIGHNIKFDLAVLDKVLQYYDIPFEALTYADTMKKAKDILTDANSLKLNSLCEYFGIRLDQHHDAMCDTKACRDLYHMLSQYKQWNESDEQTYWFGRAKIKADPNELETALLDLNGILFGVVSDGVIDSEELLAIEVWSLEHENQRKYAGFREAYDIVDRIIDTGIIRRTDFAKLYQLLSQNSGKLYSRTTIALQTLKGIVFGIISDGKINEHEIISLKQWMLQNQELKGNYPFDTIFKEIEKVMEDNCLSLEEAEKLNGIFMRFIDPMSIKQDSGNVSFEGKTCCLSGNFLCGSKADVEKIINDRGGLVVPSVTKKTDYLIVGGEGSSAWAYGNYGSKVKKALKMQEDGHHIKILGETEIM